MTNYLPDLPHSLALLALLISLIAIFTDRAKYKAQRAIIQSLTEELRALEPLKAEFRFAWTDEHNPLATERRFEIIEWLMTQPEDSYLVSCSIIEGTSPHEARYAFSRYSSPKFTVEIHNPSVAMMFKLKFAGVL